MLVPVRLTRLALWRCPHSLGTVARPAALRTLSELPSLLSMQLPSFPSSFDDEFPAGPDGQRAYVGLNVLRGLITGIDQALEAHQQERSARKLGPVVLGVSPWLTDPELLGKLRELTGACIVITKQGRSARDQEQLRDLHELNANTPGLPVDSFPDLVELAPHVDDKPVVVGPYDRVGELVIPTVRTLGFRRQASQSGYVPLMHAKLALLGDLWWHDEDALGYATNVTGFRARCLWVSSANFTVSSRASLEYGFWTEDPALLEGVQRFLLRLIAASEGLAGGDAPNPQFLAVDYDDQAMREAMADTVWDEDADDE